MGVQVFIMLMAMTMTEFVSGPFGSTIYDMHEVVVTEKGKSTENTRFVYREYLVFQFRQTHRTKCTSQFPYNHNAIGSRLDAMFL